MTTRAVAITFDSPPTHVATITWCTDPFLGKINSETHEGIKLYTTANKEQSKDGRLSASKDNVEMIIETFRGDCNNFG